MSKNMRFWIGLSLSLCLLAPFSYAQDDINAADGLGRTIQISTHFASFEGKPMWLLMIRDIDHNQNIPYMFDITRGDNFWVPLTYGTNYLITASNLQIEYYDRSHNGYRNYRVRDFCHMESNGRINRGDSMFVTITGNLSPYRRTYSCQINKFQDTSFTVVDP